MEAITLEQASFVTAIIGGIAVITSLLYLARQVRRNTRTTHLLTVQAISSEYNNFYDMLASNQELVDIWQRGMFDFQSLDAREKERFTIAVTRVFRNHYEQYFQWHEGAMAADFWQSWVALFADSIQFSGFREVWSRRKHHYPSAFQLYVDKLIAEPKGAIPSTARPAVTTG